MGSSKKHKEKDKDRDRERRREKDRKHRDRDKERENKYTPECFRVKGMNIVHPLCPTMNLVSISLHHGKFQHFVRELKIGASSLRECLDSVYSVGFYFTCVSRMYTYLFYLNIRFDV